MGEEENSPRRDASGRFLPKSEQEADSPEGTEEVPSEDAEEVVKVGSGERPADETPMERVERLARGDLKEGEWIEDISDTVAPSVGPKSVVFHHPHEDVDHDVSLDAMGNDKRRQVVGNSYGPSFARQALIYGIFVAIIAGLFIGGRIAIDKLDQPPDHIEAQAPWAQPNAPQKPPKPLE